MEPFGEVAEWYESSRLECGRWARFYELHTNRPLYCTPDRVITYSDEDLRPGYGWKGNYGERVFGIVERVKELGRDGILAERDAVPNDEEIKRLGRAAMEALDALDERNLWLETRISCSNFNRRMGELCAYLEAVQSRKGLQ